MCDRPERWLAHHLARTSVLSQRIEKAPSSSVRLVSSPRARAPLKVPGDLDEFLKNLSRGQRTRLVAGNGCLQPFRKGHRSTHVPFGLRAHLSTDQPLQCFDRQVALLHLSDLGQDLIRDNGDVGALEPRSPHDVDDLGRYDRATDDLLDGRFPVRGVASTSSIVLHRGRPDCLK